MVKSGSKGDMESFGRSSEDAKNKGLLDPENKVGNWLTRVYLGSGH